MCTQQAKLASVFRVSPSGEQLTDAAVRLAASNPHASGLITQAISKNVVMDYNAFPRLTIPALPKSY